MLIPVSMAAFTGRIVGRKQLFEPTSPATRNTLARFLEAQVEGTAEYLKNPEVAKKVIGQYMKIGPVGSSNGNSADLWRRLANSARG